MYESIWFDGFLFGMSLVESSFPTDTGGKDSFMWMEKPSTFVKYVLRTVSLRAPIIPNPVRVCRRLEFRTWYRKVKGDDAASAYVLRPL